jgi:hypothetical protein
MEEADVVMREAPQHPHRAHPTAKADVITFQLPVWLNTLV